MKLKLPKLHNQILIALVLGAIFGSIFNTNTHRLELKVKSADNNIITTAIDNWDKVLLITQSAKPDTFSFDKNQQLDIIAKSKSLSKTKYALYAYGFNYKNDQTKIEEKAFTSVISIAKEKTIAVWIKWIGDIFIRLLNMIAVPLVLASLIVGAASLGDIKKFARIGSKTLALYLTTTALAITIGLSLANIIHPGNMMPQATKDRLLSVYQGDISERLESELSFDVGDFLVNMVPRNPFAAIAGAEMLQIVFFAVMVGMILTMISKEKSEPIIKFFDGLSEAMIKLVDVVMLIAPLGVFALISSTVAEFGFDILQTLLWYAVTVLLGLALHTFGVYGLIVRFFSKVKVKDFFRGVRRMQMVAFTTSSSAATLPVNMEVCQENLGVSKSVTSFVLPLGATINMDGTALYQGVAAVFIAQVFGMDLSIGQQLTIILTAVLASIGTAPVPGVGIIMLVIILKSVGIPQVGIALIIGIDRILDMCRTVTNVTGDAAVTVAIASSENEIGKPINTED